MNSDEVKIRLESVYKDDWRKKLDRRVSKLPKQLRSIAAGAVKDKKKNDHQAFIEVKTARIAAGQELDNLSTADLHRVMAALAPEISDELTTWWKEAPQFQYSGMRSRRGFRAPNNPEVSLGDRVIFLANYVFRLAPYERDLSWFIQWAGHYRDFQDLGPLLAAAMSQPGDLGDKVFDELRAVVCNEHATAIMGSYVIVGLLRSNRSDAWELIENLLVAAGRQEGLRTAILDSADEARLPAFIRLLGVIERENLTRFASTIHAVDKWVGCSLDTSQTNVVKRILSQLRSLLEEETPRWDPSQNPEDTYVTLIAQGIIDVDIARFTASQILERGTTDQQVAAAMVLRSIGDSAAPNELFEFLEHDDVRVAAWASLGLGPFHTSAQDYSEAMREFGERMPAKISGKTEIFDIRLPLVRRDDVLRFALRARKDSCPLETFIPLLNKFDGFGRAGFANQVKELDVLSPELRSSMFDLISGRSRTAREAAIGALEAHTIGDSEARELEPLLTRKSTATRESVVRTLTKLSDQDRVESAKRLWDTGNRDQRNAACSLIVDLDTREGRDSVQRFATEGDDRQRQLLEGESNTTSEALANLFDPALIPVGAKPTKHKLAETTLDMTSAALPGLIDDIFEQYKNTEVVFTYSTGSSVTTLGDAGRISGPVFSGSGYLTTDGLLIEDVLRPWWEEWSADQKGDPAEIAGRALLAVRMQAHSINGDWDERYWGKVLGHSIGQLRHPYLVQHTLGWLSVQQATSALLTHLLDVMAWQIGQFSKQDLRDHIIRADEEAPIRRRKDLRDRLGQTVYYHGVTALMQNPTTPDELLRRYWDIEIWRRLPLEGANLLPVGQYKSALLFERDLIDRHSPLETFLSMNHGHVHQFTKRKRDEVEAKYPKTVALVDQLRNIAVSAELARGELPTDMTHLIRRFGSVEGVEVAMTALERLGKLALSKRHRGGTNRSGTLSHLISICYPTADDTVESLNEAAKRRGITESRLIDFAMFAPQWARLVEEAIGWPGYEDAVWWFHMHTRGRSFALATELREDWGGAPAAKTPLSNEELLDGSVDAEWFRSTFEALGPERWKKVLHSSKHASTGADHTRAVAFADALSGEVNERDLIERIEKKRHQDTVRALGLVPLPKSGPGRKKALLKRYGALREFERTSKKFGSVRRASEGTAVRIGIENLARNAGYRDPMQFSWAMESAEMADLAAGPVTAKKDDLLVTLSVDQEGVPQLSVSRAGKDLKVVPTKVRKDKAIAPLLERKTSLGKQVSRIRRSLESAMINVDHFQESDLDLFRAHPLVSPMMSTLVLVDESGKLIRPQDSAFVDVDGKKVKPKGSMRFGHPVDFMASGQWSDWQQWLFVHEIRQPFKQLFRELYVPTKSELSNEPASHRYSGHQVQPKQAGGLFQARGWEVDFQSRNANRTFHANGVVASTWFQSSYFTAAAIELPMLESIEFTNRGNYRRLKIGDVPSVVFSETMRDIDLVVSVAHAGGVDPEASESTIEMRRSLAHEMVRLLGLENVTFTENHALIDGSLGDYSLHLGSGVVHRRPGGHIFIVPVHAQRRGRLFLPFVDDDPRSAEIMTKLLTFSRDKEIQDPTILEQLRGR